MVQLERRLCGPLRIPHPSFSQLCNLLFLQGLKKVPKRFEAGMDGDMHVCKPQVVSFVVHVGGPCKRARTRVFLPWFYRGMTNVQLQVNIDEMPGQIVNTSASVDSGCDLCN